MPEGQKGPGMPVNLPPDPNIVFFLANYTNPCVIQQKLGSQFVSAVLPCLTTTSLGGVIE